MKIGIEMEFTGVNRIELSQLLANYFGNVEWSVEKGGYRFVDYKKREWWLVTNVSVRPELCQNHNPEMRVSASEDDEPILYQNEIRTPVISWDNNHDRRMLEKILFIVKILGGIVNESCSMHVHIDKPEGDEMLAIFMYVFRKKQYNAFLKYGISKEYRHKYARAYSADVDCHSLKTLDDIMKYISDNYPDATNRDGSIDTKHFALNFQSIIDHGTIEFRAFNSVLDFIGIQDAMDFVKSICEEVEKEYRHGWWLRSTDDD